MEVTSRAHKPLSRTGEWLMLVSQQQNNVKNLYLRCVPGMLLDKISSYIQEKWTCLSEYAQQMVDQIQEKKVYRAKDWLTSISCSTSTYRIQDLLQALQKTKQNKTVKKMLIDCVQEREQQRIMIAESQRYMAANSKDKGRMCELKRDTIFHLAEVMDNLKDWKLLADGLGLHNHEYSAIVNAVQLLDIWMENYPSATVERLYFEAKELKMQPLCECIEAISAQGVARKNLIMPVESSTLFTSNVTRFHIARLESLFKEQALSVDWQSYMQKFPAYLENATFYQNCPSNALWQIANVSLSDLLNDLKQLPQIMKQICRFEEDINNGAFNHTSTGGVTLAQVLYLSKADNGLLKLRKSEAKSLTDKIKETWQELTSSDKSKIASLFSEIAKEHCKMPVQNKGLTFAQFLYLFWQYCDGLDFVAFYQLLKVKLNEYPTLCQSNLLNNLETLYDEIVPLRSYDPELAQRNRELASRVHENGLASIKAAADYDTSLCVICFDKKREYVLAPCGHLAFCAECVASLPTCSVCREPIDKIIRVIEP